MSAPLRVSEAEAGQKLVQCLTRRLGDVPPAMLHRWIRTGQVRRNGRRAKPFERVEAGDEIRLPPFAGQVSVQISAEVAPQAPAGPTPAEEAPTVTVLAVTAELLVLAKPAGLPVHPGTGHADSLITRLQAAAPRNLEDGAFAPTPAHRLDRDTSGLLLVARSYRMLRRLNDALACGEGVGKEYLAWVEGTWPWEGTQTLCDHLAKRAGPDGEKVRVAPAPDGKPREGEREARLVAHCLVRQEGRSLLHIRLLTGRTHQIRVQLAARGFPVLGDGKYGPGGAGTTRRRVGLCLHACRLILAPGLVGEAEAVFTLLPRWTGPLAVDVLPPPLPLHPPLPPAV